MSTNEEKWAHELEVLDQALSLAREKGGEARRNVDRLAGTRSSDRERPDIAIERGDGSVVGFEHFRVDRLARRDKKVRSAAKEYERVIQGVREDLLPEMEKPHISDEAVGEFGKTFYGGMRLYAQFGPDDLLRSLDARLYGDSGHARKLCAYRDSLARDYPQSPSIELGYLIEMHADLTGMFLNEGEKTTRLSSGQVPLYDGLFDMLEQASQDVDWIVIANYGSIGERIESAAVIRCKGGMFRTSCKRQGLSRTAILDPGTISGLVDMGRDFTPEFDRAGDKITFKFERALRVHNPSHFFVLSKRLAAKAVECNGSGIPFLASTGVQMTYELIRDRFPRKSAGTVNARDVERALRSISQDERDARLEAYRKRWSLEEEGEEFSVAVDDMVQGLTPTISISAKPNRSGASL